MRNFTSVYDSVDKHYLRADEEQITNEELQAIKTRAEQATPGPWIAKARAVDGITDYFLGAEIEGPPDAQRGQFARKEDAEFIANARTDVPALVAEIEQLLAMIDTMPIDAIKGLWMFLDMFPQLCFGLVGEWLKSESEPKDAQP